MSIFLFIMVWLISELNTFFLKHVFAVDTSHPVVFWRIIFIALISAPSIRYAFTLVFELSNEVIACISDSITCI